ncbi:hypothetical protein F183_A36480 [Bryobacterales bacterium F-183]|nr:hypothetical protein F183_A36480 [Bryobacterales bacterium F-183]
MTFVSAVLAALTIHADVVRIAVPNGGEFVTVYTTASGKRVPVVSYLKDTMGDSDPANDKLRQVWVLAHKRQSPVRHVLAAIPFLYFRMPSSAPPEGRMPPVMLDMSKPYHSTMSGLAQQILQVTTLDPLGMPYRSATRSYRQNRALQRDVRVAEAATALAMSDDAEVRAVRSRLILSSRLLGGLVSDNSLDLVDEKEQIRAEEMRGRNWELLRQQAERNNLHFEPLRLAGGPPSHVLLSVTREDLQQAATSGDTRFHGRFLGISNPWTDASLRRSEEEVMPLALYSLEHPKAPLLLADMRDTLKPRRREMFRRSVQDATVGVLGVSRFASFHYFAASWTWDFVTSRRGAANNRAWRMRSYAELRQRLTADTTLEPGLRDELLKRTRTLSMNPLDDRVGLGGEIATLQHAALQRYAENPRGMALLLERGRQDEAALFSRGPKRRAAVEALRWATLGLYKRHVATTPVMLAEVDRRRKISTHTRLLEQALLDTPAIETASDAAAIRNSIRELTRLESKDPAVTQLLARAARHSSESAVPVGPAPVAAVDGPGGSPEEE